MAGKKAKKGNRRKSRQAAVGCAENLKLIEEAEAGEEELEASLEVEAAAEAGMVTDKKEKKQVKWRNTEKSLISDLEDLDEDDCARLSTLVYTPENVEHIPLDEYEKVETLAVSDMGRVRIVRHKSTGKLFAMKVVLVPEEEEAFSRKAIDQMALAPTLNHPNIVKCHGVQSKLDLAYFLSDIMAYSLKYCHTKDEATLAWIAQDVLSGLSYLRREKNFVFRYLTPSNILYDENDGNFKIGDVGSMRDALILRNAPQFIEGYRYVAPEHICLNDYRRAKHFEFDNGDVWSLGMCLLEVYLGRFPIDYDRRMARKGGALPFFEEDPPQAPPQAPPESSRLFRNFISRCLKRSPDKRANVSELLSDPFVTYSRESKL